jgi:hypothetical protein
MLIRLTLLKPENLLEKPKNQKGFYFKFETDFLYGDIFGPLKPETRLVFYALCLSAIKQNSYEISVDLDNIKQKLAIISENKDIVSDLKVNNIINLTSRINHRINRIEENRRDIVTPVGAPNPSLISIWNDNCGQLSKIKGSSDKRNKLCKDRLKENPSIDYWASVVREISQTSFCLGQNDRGWKANFDWFLKSETHLKVMEGQYKSKSDEKRMILKEIKSSQKGNLNESKSKFIRTDKSSEDKKENNNMEV